MKKLQVVVVHGGEAFNSYRDYLKFLKNLKADLDYLHGSSWKESLQKKLGRNYEVVRLQMPNKLNAKYLEWKIYFQKYIPFFKDNVIFVGHSLGGIFLAKYLSENKYPKKIKATYLVAAPHNEARSNDSLGDFKLGKSLQKFSKQSKNIILFQSLDDRVVPPDHVEIYKKYIPTAKVVMFKNKQHFNQITFPELVKYIKGLL